MQLHQLVPKTKLKREKRVGRGDKTAGRGTKGQKARAGAKIRPALRDLLKKIPKRRGSSFRPFRPKPAVVALAAVARRFAAGETVSPQALLAKGLVRRIKGRIPAVKVLGGAPLAKRLAFRGIALSASARAAVEAAGGGVR